MTRFANSPGLLRLQRVTNAYYFYFSLTYHANFGQIGIEPEIEGDNFHSAIL